MSLHADVAVPARDRKRLERLCRYVARPPIAIDCLEALPDGRLAYRLASKIFEPLVADEDDALATCRLCDYKACPPMRCPVALTLGGMEAQ